jgi:hypothetical protein
MLLGLAVAGCTSWFRASIPPASAPFAPAASASVWSASLAELQARGFGIEAQDVASGTVRTATRVMPGSVPCGFIQCSYRDTIHVTVAPGGEVDVRIQRELSTLWVASTSSSIMGGQRWEPPASTQRSTVEGVVADQTTLLRAILERAGAATPAQQANAATTGEAAR